MIYSDFSYKTDDKNKFVYYSCKYITDGPKKGERLTEDWDFEINLKTNYLSDLEIQDNWNHLCEARRRLTLKEFENLGGNVLEVGVQAGMHASWMNDILNPNAFHLVDKSFSNKGPNLEKLNLLNNPHIKLYETTSMEAVELFEDNFFDYIYIDAAHDYNNVMKDINGWMSKLKTGGVMAGHDYYISAPLINGEMKANDSLPQGYSFYENPLQYMNCMWNNKINFTGKNIMKGVTAAVNDYVYWVNQENDNENLVLELRFEKEEIRMRSSDTSFGKDVMGDLYGYLKNDLEWYFIK